MTSTELVLYRRPRKADRRRARWARRRQAVGHRIDALDLRHYAIAGAGTFIAGTTVLLAVSFSGGASTVARTADVQIGDAIHIEAAAPNPTTTTVAPSTLPPPVAATLGTAGTPTVVHIDVDLPGWSGQGQLVTDGAASRRVYPGQVGRAVVAVPFDPTGAASFNAAGRQWRVFVRGQAPAVADVTRVGVTAVPTLLVVDSREPHKFVEGS